MHSLTGVIRRFLRVSEGRSRRDSELRLQGGRLRGLRWTFCLLIWKGLCMGPPDRSQPVPLEHRQFAGLAFNAGCNQLAVAHYGGVTIGHGGN